MLHRFKSKEPSEPTVKAEAEGTAGAVEVVVAWAVAAVAPAALCVWLQPVQRSSAPIALRSPEQAAGALPVDHVAEMVRLVVSVFAPPTYPEAPARRWSALWISGDAAGR